MVLAQKQIHNSKKINRDPRNKSLHLCDVFKGLALGANAVSVSRHILAKTYESGADGVEKEIRKMTGELVSVMGRCGFATVDSIDDSVIWK